MPACFETSTGSTSVSANGGFGDYIYFVCYYSLFVCFNPNYYFSSKGYYKQRRKYIIYQAVLMSGLYRTLINAMPPQLLPFLN